MLLPKVTVLTLFAVAGSALAGPTAFNELGPEKPEYEEPPPPVDIGVFCETSEHSPINVDITNAINELRGKEPHACGNYNNKGTKCRTVVEEEEASIGLCGINDDRDEKRPEFTCQQIAKFAAAIQKKCQDGSGGGRKTGGIYAVSAGKRVVLYRTGHS